MVRYTGQQTRGFLRDADAGVPNSSSIYDSDRCGSVIPFAIWSDWLRSD